MVRNESLKLVALLEQMVILEVAVLSYCHEECRMKEKRLVLSLMKNWKKETI